MNASSKQSVIILETFSAYQKQSINNNEKGQSWILLQSTRRSENRCCLLETFNKIEIKKKNNQPRQLKKDDGTLTEGDSEKLRQTYTKQISLHRCRKPDWSCGRKPGNAGLQPGNRPADFNKFNK